MAAIACIILAAGHGTRMRSEKPKVLHEIGGQPMLHRVMALGRAIEADRTVVVVGAGGERVSKAARNFDANVAIAVQNPPQGTGHAVQEAMPALEGFEGHVIVLYADTPMLTPRTLRALLAELEDGAAVSVLGFRSEAPGAYGRLVQGADGHLDRIVEHKDATEEERQITLCNSGLMAARADILRDLLPTLSNDNAQGEYYLTDIPGLATAKGHRAGIVTASLSETAGVNNREELAAAEATFQGRRRCAAMAGGVTFLDPQSVYFSHDTVLGQDVTVGPNVVFGPGVTVEADVRIEAFCHLEGAIIRGGATVGPFARLRPGADIGPDAHVGNFVEIKKTALGQGAKVGHLTYLGDAEIGAGVNIGAGTITCNYDGAKKHRTVVGKGAFVGSNSSLVAPVTLGAGSYVGSGSVITEDVPDDALALGRGRQSTKGGWGTKFRNRVGEDG